MLQFLEFHYVFTCEVTSLSCFIFQFKNHFGGWRSLRWNCGKVSPFPRQNKITRSCDLVLSPPSWGLIKKDKLNDKVKSVVNVHVFNEIDMWCWFFGCGNSFIINKMNLEWYGENFVVFLCFSNFRMGVHCEDKGR